MVAICLIHNNEADRLAYIKPHIAELAAALERCYLPTTVREVGPDASGMVGKVARHTAWNRARRAWEWSGVLDRVSQADPRMRHLSHAKLARRFQRNFRRNMWRYPRSVTVEQEVLFAHAVAWREAAREAGPSFVFESDLRFDSASVRNLCSIAKFAESIGGESYIDLAGGCDPKKVLGAWHFEKEHGCKTTSIDAVELLELSAFVGNTVGGYLISPAAASRLCRLVERPPLLAPDWALTSWAAAGKLEGVRCFHAAPHVLLQGSATGAYASTIDAEVESRTTLAQH